ncbi:unnamed protein product [Diplocarpon coronariae]
MAPWNYFQSSGNCPLLPRQPNTAEMPFYSTQTPSISSRHESPSWSRRYVVHTTALGKHSGLARHAIARMPYFTRDTDQRHGDTRRTHGHDSSR